MESNGTEFCSLQLVPLDGGMETTTELVRSKCAEIEAAM